MKEGSKTLFLTGATGLLGRRFAYRLAALGHRVVGLVRAHNDAAAAERCRAALQELRDFVPDFDASAELRIQAVAGDVRRPDLGLSPDARDKLKGTSSVWHLAALNDWNGSANRDAYETNFAGTLHVLDWARGCGAAEIHYFSAWSASGETGRGVIREIPGIRPPRFRNTFERTKWEAERHLWQAQVRGEAAVTIYRPAMAIGDSAFGRCERPTRLSCALAALGRARAEACLKRGVDPRGGVLEHDFRIAADPGTMLPLAPIDFIVETALKVASAPRSRGRVYHLMLPKPPVLQSVLEAFRGRLPWNGLRCEGPGFSDFRDDQERSVSEAFRALCGEAGSQPVYDASNVESVLAFHGGAPQPDPRVCLEAAVADGARRGWPDREPRGASAPLAGASDFRWPEQDGMSVDFAPSHPQGDLPGPDSGYGLTERLLGRAYRVRESLLSMFRRTPPELARGNRDLVLLPFGMGVTRRGDAELQCYQHNEPLADQVFAFINQIAGFDVRAFGRQAVPGHESFAEIGDHCTWAVADDLAHAIRLFRDVQRTGGKDFGTRLQILPHSAGTHVAGWLSGIMSLQDAALMTIQTTGLMAEGDRLLALEEVDRWFFAEEPVVSESERNLLHEIRQKHELELEREALADHLHGKLELVYSLNAEMFSRFLVDLRESGIRVSHAITMSPNAGVFAGDELEMAKLRKLFAQKAYIGLRRMPLEVRGTPHFDRFGRVARHTAELLEYYDRQGRLRDPVVPLTSCDGGWVRTRHDFIQAISGNAGRTYRFDEMIGLALEAGGRHFLLMQSGLATLTGDLFDGVIRNKANSLGIAPVHVYRPQARSPEPHPVCRLLNPDPTRAVPNAAEQSLQETVRWYERLMSDFPPRAAVAKTEYWVRGELQ